MKCAYCDQPAETEFAGVPMCLDCCVKLFEGDEDVSTEDMQTIYEEF